MTFRKEDDFDAESYVRVNVRLQEFWDKYPDGRVETEHSFHGDVLVMTAKLYRSQDSQHPSGVGHAFLENMYGDKVGEYTETVAVGRALAMMGFKIEKSIASSQEMDRWRNRHQRESTPVTIPIPSPVDLSDIGSDGGLESSRFKKEISDVPQEPKTLKSSRIFKPRPKDVTQGESK